MAMLTQGTERSQKNRLQDSATSTCQKAHAHEETTANMFTTLRQREVGKKDAEEDVVEKGENKTRNTKKNPLVSSVEK